MAMSAGVSTLTNMRVRTRMMLGFSAVRFLIVLLTTIGIWRVGEIDSGLAHINDVNSVMPSTIEAAFMIVPSR